MKRFLVAALAAASAHAAVLKPTLASPKRADANLPRENNDAKLEINANLLTLRGGASLGPITPGVLLKVNTLMAVYFTALFVGLLQWLPEGPMMGGLGSTKFGYESSQMMDLQMAGGLFYFGSMLGLVAWTGSEAQHLLACKSLTITWAVCSAIFWFGTLNGAAFTESNVLAPIMTLVYAYLGFA